MYTTVPQRQIPRCLQCCRVIDAHLVLESVGVDTPQAFCEMRVFTQHGYPGPWRQRLGSATCHGVDYECLPFPVPDGIAQWCGPKLIAGGVSATIGVDVADLAILEHHQRFLRHRCDFKLPRRFHHVRAAARTDLEC